MRNSVTLAIVAIICLIALLATDRRALAQAGSIGGTIGKTDKSVSGGEMSEPSDRGATRTKEKTKQRTFRNPTVNGQPVDYCLLNNAGACGEQAAVAWCQRNGFANAASWRTERSPVAYRLGDGSSCNGLLGCDVFTIVNCN